jgi:hypothetical protein
MAACCFRPPRLSQSTTISRTRFAFFSTFRHRFKAPSQSGEHFRAGHLHDRERQPRRSRGCTSIRLSGVSHQAILGHISGRVAATGSAGLVVISAYQGSILVEPRGVRWKRFPSYCIDLTAALWRPFASPGQAPALNGDRLLRGWGLALLSRAHLSPPEVRPDLRAMATSDAANEIRLQSR